VDPRPHVVFVDHVARLSGGEIALLRLLPALAAHVDAHVVLGEDGPLAARLRDAGIETEVLPLATRVRDVRKETVRAGRVDVRAIALLAPYVLRLSRRLRELNADLVHTNSLKAAFYAGLAGRMARVPVVWHVRDRIAPDYLPRPAVRFVRLASQVLPSAVIANSQTTLDTLPQLRRRDVIALPVPDAVDSAPTRTRRDDDDMVIGVVGRIASWKGQDVFLDAFAQAFGGTAVRGRIIGDPLFGEDAYAESLREQADRLGISDQIEFRGFREDVWAELRELDILVHCSVVPEPFGQVVLEGMAAGLPVVAAGAGGPAEIVTTGVDGILTPPGDARELARVLRTLHDDPPLRARLAEAGRRRSRDFTPERTAREVLKVYAAVLEQR
jgi:glycosyltransferase involved in cell wall biosynthesis